MTHIRTPFRRGRAASGAIAALVVATGLATAVAAVPAAGAAESGPTLKRLDRPVSFKDGRYVVVLREPAATGYRGGKPGLAATADSGTFDGRSRAVAAYRGYLRAQQQRLARAVGADVAASYTVALNGFAAKLSGAQAAELSRDRRVLLVQPDEARSLNTNNTPSFLGLEGPKGVWAQRGGARTAGAGTVVGILDSGIWPESDSFKGRPLTSTPTSPWDIHRIGDRVYMDKADGTRFQGACELGDGWEADDCNMKLIGARYYPDAFEDLDPADQSPDEWVSTRDGDGHGTHTAGTAAGNRGVAASVEGRDFGTVSGMAPAARIAAYKVCFSDTNPDTGDCYTSSSLAAIDDAVLDGVDVINYSISGSVETVIDSVELAFEGAAEAGVFVATSAGNSGPDASTVAHPSPWLTTVAASTHVNYENTVVLGNGTKLVGASINGTPLAAKPLIDSAEAAADTSVEGIEDATLCGPDTLDGSVAGKIVICTRGVYDRVAKSAEVERAGGVGMILVNPSENSLDADFHSVPTVHLSVDDGETVLDYLDTAASPTARFVVGNTTPNKTPLPQISGFSSRGPSLANDGDILKPDIAAPGTSVLAAVAPPTNSGRDFDLYSGTSMASPHIAGLAAFIESKRPGWGPMRIKSAMMTTARSLLDDAGNPAHDPFAQGAGNVRPARFFDPGLFVLSSRREWLGFITGQGLDTGVPALAAKDLNQPSMAFGEVVNSVEFSRQFVSTRKGTWKVTANVPGFTAAMSSNKLVSKRAKDIEDLTVTFTRTSAPLTEFATGFVTLTGPTTVRIPVALRPVSVSAPGEVSGTGATGSAQVDITASTTGDLPITVSGLGAGLSDSSTVSAGDFAAYCIEGFDPATAKVLRATVDAVDDSADLDLSVYGATGSCATLVSFDGQSATGSADEQVTITNPTEEAYAVFVDGYADPVGETTTDYTADFWVVDASSTEGAFAANPNPVPTVAGEPTSFDAEWTGLGSGSYLGILEYDGALSPTYVTVDVP